MRTMDVPELAGRIYGILKTLDPVRTDLLHGKEVAVARHANALRALRDVRCQIDETLKACDWQEEPEPCDERAQFEAAMKGFMLTKCQDGTYWSMATQRAWVGWQAAAQQDQL